MALAAGIGSLCFSPVNIVLAVGASVSLIEAAYGLEPRIFQKPRPVFNTEVAVSGSSAVTGDISHVALGVDCQVPTATSSMACPCAA